VSAENNTNPVEQLEKRLEKTAADLGVKLKRFNDALVKGFSKLLESPFKKEERSGIEGTDEGDENP